MQFLFLFNLIFLIKRFSALIIKIFPHKEFSKFNISRIASLAMIVPIIPARVDKTPSLCQSIMSVLGISGIKHLRQGELFFLKLKTKT